MHPAVLTATAVAGAGAVCVAYGTFVERHWYRLRRLEIAGGRRRLTILHLSDVHLRPPAPRIETFLDEVAAADYDLVVATGDLLGAEGAEDACAELLGRLTERAPGVVVFGSNDVYAPAPKGPTHYFLTADERVFGAPLDVAGLSEALAERGYHVLRNGTEVIETAAGPVAVGGLDDPHLAETPLPALGEVRCPTGDVVARVGVVHAPYTDALDLLVDAGYELLLAGHTHGGQVRFPPVGALVNNCDLPLDRSRGLSRWRDAWLHVSPGLGTNVYAPFRFACRPEATLLTL